MLETLINALSLMHYLCVTTFSWYIAVTLKGLFGIVWLYTLKFVYLLLTQVMPVLGRRKY